MDFGIARVRTSDVKTQAGTLLGSPKYMSPEQVVGKAVDHRSDIFSLGVVLYEMLAGAAPFSGEDVPQIMFQVCNARALAPSRLNPAVHEVLDLVVAKALEKNPEDRYQKADDLAADLRTFLDGAQPLRAPRPADTGMHVVEATVPDKTAPRASANPSDALGLSPWRRFDSARAIERLARPRGDDRALMAATIARATLTTRLRHDRVFVYKLVSTAVALAIAAAIVLA
jgi:serine/threonine-protein kinase